MEKKPISRAGFDALLKELKDLKENQRPEILKIVQWARSLGDLSENADYSAAKEKQRQIDKRIQFIEGVVGNANVVDVESLSGDRVVFGAKVVAEEEDGENDIHRAFPFLFKIAVLQDGLPGLPVRFQHILQRGI